MLGEPKNQFSLTRAALSTCGAQKLVLISNGFPPHRKRRVAVKVRTWRNHILTASKWMNTILTLIGLSVVTPNG
jgi:hypothetical protein